MKYSGIFTLVIFLVVSAGSAFGQETGDIEASATVFGALSITASTNVAFGNVAAGFTPNIDVATEGQSSDVGSTWAEGVFDLTGSDEQNVLVTYPETINLTDDGTATTSEITYTPQVVDADRDNVSIGGSVLLGGGAADAGEQTLYVGGTLQEITTDMSGTYNATLTFSIEYQ